MGTTAGHILISYDINKDHRQVKEAMVQLGYKSEWRETQNSSIYFLPNTTLWHNNKSTNQAINDLKYVCTGLRVTLEKAVSVKASEFVVV